MTDTDSAVKVAVRVRPLNAREIDHGAVNSLVTYPDRNAVQVGDKTMGFNYVYATTSTQSDVYEECAMPMVDRVLNGFHATIFAYGQTSSGKTYTMGTSATGDGIIPRLVRDLFGTDHSITVHVSMLEVYGEKCRDLLVEGTPDLPVRWMNGEFVVANLTSERVRTAEETMSHLERGGTLRQMGATEMNAESSRSHAIVTLVVQVIDENNPDVSYRAKLNLVDLAGSERVSKTGARGQQLREGININKGLSALGAVFMALVKKQELAASKGQAASDAYHVNYRDSTLTRILADSLGGNSHTLMIACVSPADSNSDETTTTLRYAATASKIKNKPHVNQDDDRTVIVQLQSELNRVRAALAQAEIDLRDARADNAPGTHSVTATQHSVSNTNGTSETTGVNGAQMADMRDQLDLMKADRDKARQLLADSFAERQRAIACKERTMETADDVAMRMTRVVNEVEDAVAEAKRSAGSPGFALPLLITNMDAITAKMTPLVERLNVMKTSASQATVIVDDEDDDAQDDDDDEPYAVVHGRHSTNVMKYLETTQAADVAQSRRGARIAQMEVGLASEIEDNETRAKLERENERLDSKVRTLEKEMATLSEQLSSVGHKTNLAEERRKKLQTLEKMLADARNKLARQRDVEANHKRQCEDNARLRKELDHLKRQKVKLALEMEKASQAYQRQNLIYKRQLAAAEKKNSMELNKREQGMRTVQQQLRRYRDRTQQAEAIIKRLRAQTVTASRNRRHNARGGKDATDSKALIDGELRQASDIAEAKAVREGLIEERTELTKELNATKRQRDRAVDPALRATLGEKTKQLEQECTIRTNKLQETNAQLDQLRNDDEDGERWAWVTEIVDARGALEHLFAQAVEATVARATASEELRVAMTTIDEHADNIVALEKEIGAERAQYENKLFSVQRYGEVEVAQLKADIRNMVHLFSKETKEAIESGSLSADDLSVFKEIADKYAGVKVVDDLEEALALRTRQYTEAAKENGDYRAQMGKVKRRPLLPPVQHMENAEVNPPDGQSTRSGRTCHRPALLGAVTGDDWHNSLASPAVKSKARPPTRVVETTFVMDSIEEYDDDVTASLTRTPISHNRRKSLADARRRNGSGNESLDSSKTNKCSCKSSCDSRRCPCRKAETGCSSACKCPSTCTNEKASLDVTFDMPEEVGGLSSDKWKNSVKRPLLAPLQNTSP